MLNHDANITVVIDDANELLRQLFSHDSYFSRERTPPSVIDILFFYQSMPHFIHH